MVEVPVIPHRELACWFAPGFPLARLGPHSIVFGGGGSPLANRDNLVAIAAAAPKKILMHASKKPARMS